MNIETDSLFNMLKDLPMFIYTNVDYLCLIKMTLTEMLNIYKLTAIVELAKYDINYKSVVFTNKTEFHDLTEILLKVVLNTITVTYKL